MRSFRTILAAATGLFASSLVLLTVLGCTATSNPGNAPLIVPILSGVSPASAVAGSGPLTITLSGTGFLPSTLAYWNGAPRTTSYVSATQITVMISAADVATTGTAIVTAANGSASSNGVAFTIASPAAPSVTGLSPGSVTAGSGALTLTVNGANFLSGAIVQWNGSPRTTTFVSSAQLTAQLTATDVATAGSWVVTVANGTTVSNGVVFTISAGTNPIPTLTAISPNMVLTGTTAVTLHLTGTSFVPGAAVYLDALSGAYTLLPTTFVNSTEVDATLPTSFLTTAGGYYLYVLNPTPGGGRSIELPLSVTQPQGINVPFSGSPTDLTYDSANGLIYVSMASGSAQNPGMIVGVDPASGMIKSTTAEAWNAGCMAASDDGAYLYACNGTMVQRFLLPSLTPDISVDLFPQYGGVTVSAVRPKPGDSHTFAVAAADYQTTSRFVRPGVVLCKDATILSNDPGAGSFVYDIEWNAAGTEIYGSRSDAGFGYSANHNSAGYYKYSLTGSTFTGIQTFAGTSTSDMFGNLTVDPVTNYLYTQYGEVFNASTGALIASMPQKGAPTPSPGRGRLYFPISTTPTGGSLQTYDLATRTLLVSYALPSLVGFPSRLVTWGTNGVAFITPEERFAGQGKLYLLSGAGVTTP